MIHLRRIFLGAVIAFAINGKADSVPQSIDVHAGEFAREEPGQP